MNEVRYRLTAKGLRRYLAEDPSALSEVLIGLRNGMMDLDDFKSETAEWMQALDETLSDVRRMAVAADAQAKAQALAFAEFERRWTARVDALTRLLVRVGRRLGRLEKGEKDD